MLAGLFFLFTCFFLFSCMGASANGTVSDSNKKTYIPTSTCIIAVISRQLGACR